MSTVEKPFVPDDPDFKNKTYHGLLDFVGAEATCHLVVDDGRKWCEIFCSATGAVSNGLRLSKREMLLLADEIRAIAEGMA